MATDIFFISSEAEIVCHTDRNCAAVQNMDHPIKAELAVDRDGVPVGFRTKPCALCAPQSRRRMGRR